MLKIFMIVIILLLYHPFRTCNYSHLLYFINLHLFGQNSDLKCHYHPAVAQIGMVTARRVGSIPVCLEFGCSPCVSMGSLWVLQLPLTVQRNAC